MSIVKRTNFESHVEYNLIALVLACYSSVSCSFLFKNDFSMIKLNKTFLRLIENANVCVSKVQFAGIKKDNANTIA